MLVESHAKQTTAAALTVRVSVRCFETLRYCYSHFNRIYYISTCTLLFRHHNETHITAKSNDKCTQNKFWLVFSTIVYNAYAHFRLFSWIVLILGIWYDVAMISSITISKTLCELYDCNYEPSAVFWLINPQKV